MQVVAAAEPRQRLAVQTSLPERARAGELVPEIMSESAHNQESDGWNSSLCIVCLPVIHFDALLSKVLSRSFVAGPAGTAGVRAHVQAERRMKARISTSIPMERP